MKITQNFVCGLARVGQNKAADPPRTSPEQPRSGRDLSRRTAHQRYQSPLEYAATKLTGLITSAKLSAVPANPGGYPINGGAVRCRRISRRDPASLKNAAALYILTAYIHTAQ